MTTTRKRIRRLIQEGLCTKCGRVPPIQNQRMCTDCRKKYTELRNRPDQILKMQERKRLKHLGLSSNDYQKLIMKQRGLCAICGSPPVEKALSVDHDHITGEVRGLLCQSCNTGLGFFKDDISLLAKSIEYLSQKRISFKFDT